jgi:hypothetical protein
MLRSKQDLVRLTSPAVRREEAAPEPASRRRRISLKRYVLWSTAVATAALGVAVAVSISALIYASANAQPSRLAEVSGAIGTQMSFAFVESMNSRHEMPPPEPPRSPFALSNGWAPGDYIVRGRIANVNITFYDCAGQGFCGAMYNGRKVYEGAAACSWNLAIGTKFVIVGDPTRRIYVCEDRGLLANTWVDIFFYHPADGYRWQSLVGRYGTIEIVS